MSDCREQELDILEQQQMTRTIALLKAAAPDVCNLDWEDLIALAEVLNG